MGRFPRTQRYYSSVRRPQAQDVSLLGDRPRALEEVCQALKVAPRPAEALLSVSASLGFVELRDGRYQLTPLGEDYLVESSPTYFGSQWQIPIGNDSLFTIGNVEKAVLTNSPQTYGGTEWMKSHEENSEVARSFARSMHSASMAAALAWPEKIDLANCQTMFDIGGGSGALYRGRRTLAEAKGYRSGYRAGVRGRQRNGGEERPRRQNRHSCGGHVERSVPSRGRGRNNT